MSQGPIHLHIDELVLHGFEPAERHAIADAVQRELTSLLMQQPLHPRSGTDVRRAKANAGSVTAASSRPTDTGRQVARALHSTVVGTVAGSGPGHSGRTP